MSIYTPTIITEEIEKNFKPTRLAVKELNGIKYFCKTVKKNIEKYTGSGIRWTNHFKKYGKENIKTLWVSDWFYCPHHLQDFALMFSEYNQIVESDEWANLIPENGINGGGDASQMRTPEARLKAEATSIMRYGTPSPLSSPEIRFKGIQSCIEKYGKAAGQLCSSSSISKRNNTNRDRYGSSCAANKDGGAKSKESVNRLIGRDEVFQLKRLCRLKKVSLLKGWLYDSTDALAAKIVELSSLPDHVTDTSHYNASQLKRHTLINRENVQRLLDLKDLFGLRLGHNWFQKSDEWIDTKIIEVEQSLQHTQPQS